MNRPPTGLGTAVTVIVLASPVMAQEQIWDVAVSDGRSIDSDGRCREPVGDTVDIEDASVTTAIGDPTLGGRWRDPDFDLAHRAFCSVRVLEIPAPRWPTIDAKVFGVERLEDAPATIRERAYTRLIWCTAAR